MLDVCNLNYKIRGEKSNFTINNINFSLDDGYMMGLLGRNGAGKSTLLRLLYGVLKSDNGNITFQGEDLGKNIAGIRQNMAYVGDEDIFFESYSIIENARIFGELYKKYNNEDFLGYMNKFAFDDNVLNKRIYELSTGRKKLVYLAFVLARHPKLLLLDEPMGNLDTVYRMEFVELLQKLISIENISVIISTHLIDDIEDIADYIGILENGRMKIFGDREEVLVNGKTIRDAF